MAPGKIKSEMNGSGGKLSGACSNHGATCAAWERPTRIELIHVLNDRQVTRLHRTLSRLTSAHSARVVKQEFGRAFSAYRDHWSRPGILPTQNKLTAILFLSSQFCSVEAFDRKYQQWLDWYLERLPEEPINGSRSTDLAVTIGNRSSCFERLAGPDGLAMVNLYLLAYQRAQSAGGYPMDLDRISRNLGEISGIGELPSLKNRLLIFTEHAFPVFPHHGTATALTGQNDLGIEDRRARICAFSCARGLVASQSIMQQWLQSVGVWVPFEIEEWLRSLRASCGKSVEARPPFVSPG
jgi:hypothetical protein